MLTMELNSCIFWKSKPYVEMCLSLNVISTLQFLLYAFHRNLFLSLFESTFVCCFHTKPIENGFEESNRIVYYLWALIFEIFIPMVVLIYSNAIRFYILSLSVEAINKKKYVQLFQRPFSNLSAIAVSFVSSCCSQSQDNSICRRCKKDGENTHIASNDSDDNFKLKSLIFW